MLRRTPSARSTPPRQNRCLPIIDKTTLHTWHSLGRAAATQFWHREAEAYFRLPMAPSTGETLDMIRQQESAAVLFYGLRYTEDVKGRKFLKIILSTFSNASSNLESFEKLLSSIDRLCPVALWHPGKAQPRQVR